MRAVILAASPEPRPFLKHALSKLQVGPSDFLIGVDAGCAYWERMGYTPDLCVGDWDSLKAKDRPILKRVSCFSLPREKDRNDLYYGILAAAAGGARDLVCLGALG